jgi:ribokinase
LPRRREAHTAGEGSPRRPPALTVVGSINLDLVARCDHLPRPGETVTDAVFERHPGGKGANQAVAAARLGAAVRLVGRLGNDAFADEALAGLLDAGVELDIGVVDHPTGVALVYVDGRGDTEIVVAPGANAGLGPEDVSLRSGDALLCQLEVPGAAVAAAAAQAVGFFCLNAAPARPVAPEVLSRADLVVVNAFEYENLDKRRTKLVALTLGASGAILLRRGREVGRATPPRVTAVDGTAAGDAFCAALVVSLLEERPYDEALVRACAAGALAASRPGAQPSLPTAAEVNAILAAR